MARLTASNGPSIASLTAFAAALGYAITIQEYAPTRADELRADDPVYDLDWAFAWQVTYPGTTIEYFAADKSYADDPLETWGNSVLECELTRLKPAHTILTYAYTGTLTPAVWDVGVWDRDVWAP